MELEGIDCMGKLTSKMGGEDLKQSSLAEEKEDLGERA